tara:strand:+ start:509 stop:1882 length:1374 start_codon:yes stop_codon:yes gene_type:complete
MSKNKKIIFFELNEVPESIFVESFNYLNCNVPLNQYDFIKTISCDECHLSPWTTWPTVHRGVTYSKHKIGDLGQDTQNANKKYPPIWSALQQKGLKVGVFGSLHSSQMPYELYENYSFFIPDIFSKDSYCHPKSYNSVQSLNLYLSRRSARVVEKRFFPPFKRLFKAMYSYTITSFSFSTVWSIFSQLIQEKISPWKNIRRRTIQSDIMFDGYFRFLKKTKPDFSTFFTNHVASSMHRFWEASNPNDFKKLSHDKTWINRYENEIPNSMKSTFKYINKLTDFIDRNPEYELWIISSMGQGPCEGYKPQKQFWSINNLKIFLQNILNEEISIEVGPSMIPLYSIYTNEETIKKLVKALSKIKTNVSIKLRTVTKASLSFYFYSDEDNIFLSLNNVDIPLEGLSLKQIKEHTSSSAYHIPEGIFYRYGKNIEKIESKYFIDDYLPTDKIKELVIKSLIK